jgi:hypothetical protein
MNARNFLKRAADHKKSPLHPCVKTSTGGGTRVQSQPLPAKNVLPCQGRRYRQFKIHGVDHIRFVCLRSYFPFQAHDANIRHRFCRRICNHFRHINLIVKRNNLSQIKELRKPWPRMAPVCRDQPGVPFTSPEGSFPHALVSARGRMRRPVPCR